MTSSATADESGDAGAAATRWTECRAYALEGSPRDCVDELRRLAPRLGAYRVAPTDDHAGVVAYVDRATGARVFSVNVNMTDLAFHVHARGVARVRGGYASLARAFPSARCDAAGPTWSVRLASIADVRRLHAIVFGVDASVRDDGVTPAP